MTDNRVLVYSHNGRPVSEGDVVILRDGEEVAVTGWQHPHKPSSTGRVYVKDTHTGQEREYFPSVIGAHWANRTITPGPVSEGTMRMQDLIPTMLQELDRLSHRDWVTQYLQEIPMTAMRVVTFNVMPWEELKPTVNPDSEWWNQEPALEIYHELYSLLEEMEVYDAQGNSACWETQSGDGACVGWFLHEAPKISDED